MADFRALILQRHRQLKWKAFDPLEAILMVMCGVSIFMFTLTVLLDVITRTIGMPSLIPLTVYTAIVPMAGVLVALFTIEQLVNGWRHGFEGPEDRDETREPMI